MNKDLTSPLLERYQKYYEKDPSSRIFAPLAESYRKLGLLQEAFDILNKGIKQHPDYPMGYLVLAYCYFDKNNFDLAYNTLRPLIAQNRDNIKLQKLFGEVCVKTNRPAEALETFKYLLFINPKDKSVAERVKELEQEDTPLIDERKAVLKKNQLQLFDLSSIESGPVPGHTSSTPEDWIQVDLVEPKTDSEEKNEKIVKNQETVSSWQIDDVAKIWKKTIDAQENKKIKINLDLDTENENQIKNEEGLDFPMITHTLVDLYCEQGYYQKASEILQKLLVLDPHNKNTQEKIKQLAKLVQVGNVKEKNSEQITKKIPVIQHQRIENEGRDNLMQCLDKKLKKKKNVDIAIYETQFSKFLNAIRERAENFRLYACQ